MPEDIEAETDGNRVLAVLFGVLGMLILAFPESIWWAVRDHPPIASQDIRLIAQSTVLALGVLDFSG
ncbi:MAG: hypothetical protein QNJ35_00770 [Paracoccaceae bacterium]|nr:hypothetical protein [Paracoccaceae bacterium]